jgi:hypothetical protein
MTFRTRRSLGVQVSAFLRTCLHNRFNNDRQYMSIQHGMHRCVESWEPNKQGGGANVLVVQLNRAVVPTC